MAVCLFCRMCACVFVHQEKKKMEMISSHDGLVHVKLHRPESIHIYDLKNKSGIILQRREIHTFQKLYNEYPPQIYDGERKLIVPTFMSKSKFKTSLSRPSLVIDGRIVQLVFLQRDNPNPQCSTMRITLTSASSVDYLFITINPWSPLNLLHSHLLAKSENY